MKTLLRESIIKEELVDVEWWGAANGHSPLNHFLLYAIKNDIIYCYNVNASIFNKNMEPFIKETKQILLNEFSIDVSTIVTDFQYHKKSYILPTSHVTISLVKKLFNIKIYNEANTYLFSGEQFNWIVDATPNFSKIFERCCANSHLGRRKSELNEGHSYGKDVKLFEEALEMEVLSFCRQYDPVKFKSYSPLIKSVFAFARLMDKRDTLKTNEELLANSNYIILNIELILSFIASDSCVDFGISNNKLCVAYSLFNYKEIFSKNKMIDANLFKFCFEYELSETKKHQCFHYALQKRLELGCSFDVGELRSWCGTNSKRVIFPLKGLPKDFVQQKLKCNCIEK